VVTVQQGDRYFSVLPNSVEDGVQLSSSQLFDNIEFGIFNSRQLDSMRINVEYPESDPESGTSARETVTFQKWTVRRELELRSRLSPSNHP
jgi:hypothetical protein